MNEKHLKLVIQAHNQTAGAFNDVNAQMRGIQYQVGFFNRHALTLPRAFSQAFQGVGASAQHGIKLVGQFFTQLGLLAAHEANNIRQRSDGIIKYAKDYQRVHDQLTRDHAKFSADVIRAENGVIRARTQAQAATQAAQRADMSHQRAMQAAVSASIKVIQRETELRNARGFGTAADINTAHNNLNTALAQQANANLRVAAAAQTAQNAQVNAQNKAAAATQANMHVQQAYANHQQSLANVVRSSAINARAQFLALSQAVDLDKAMDFEKFSKVMATVGGVITGIGQSVSSTLAIVGSVGNVLLQVFGAVLNIILQIVQVIVNEFVAAIKTVGTAAGIITIAVAAIGTAVGKAGLDFNSFKEQTLISFEVMFGSAKKANDEFDRLKHFADITPFDTKETIEAGKQLAAYGLDASRYLTVAGNLAAAFNKPLLEAVDLLGRARAGMYHMREFAGFGLTRDRLSSIGYQFKPNGEPVDRANLLPAIEKVTQRDFGGMMERQSRSTKGLESTIVAFWTEDFPGRVTEGLHKARHSILLFLMEVTQRFANSPVGEIITRGLKQVFDAVGGLAQMVAQKIPTIIAWFGALVVTGRWEKFLKVVFGVFTTAFNFINQGIQWVAGHWDRIWQIIGTVTVNIVKVIGGVIAGVINIFVELVTGNINAQRSFENLGNSIKAFVIQSIYEVGKLIVMLGLLQMALGAIEGIVALLTKNPTLGAKAAVDIVTGMVISAGAIMGAGQLIKEISTFDPKKYTDAFKDMEKTQGFVGAFVRGYMNFGRGVNDVVKNFGNGVELPNIKPLQDPFLFNGKPNVGSMLDPQKEAYDNMVDMAKSQKEAVQAWEQIVAAAKAYGATLSNSKIELQMNVHAHLGLLDALNTMRNIDMQILSMEKAGTKDWWERLEVVNKSAAAMTKVKEELRQMLFDTSRLHQQGDTQGKIFGIMKDLGAPPKEMLDAALQQVDVLSSQMALERAKLSTMEQGTVEWHKQRGVIVDIIAKIVNLRKELKDANIHIADPKLANPATPFGQRGAAFGPEKFIQQTGSMWADIKKLIDFAINPKFSPLEGWARGMGKLPGMGGFGTGAEKPHTVAESTPDDLAAANARHLAPLFAGAGLGGGTGTSGSLPSGAPTFPGGMPGVPTGSVPAGDTWNFGRNRGQYAGQFQHPNDPRWWSRTVPRTPSDMYADANGYSTQGYWSVHSMDMSNRTKEGYRIDPSMTPTYAQASGYSDTNDGDTRYLTAYGRSLPMATGNGGVTVNVPVDLSNLTVNDEATIRREARKIFDEELEVALSKIRQQRSNKR